MRLNDEYFIKENDKGETIEAVLLGHDEEPVNLSGVEEVRFQMGRRSEDSFVDHEAEIVDEDLGRVQYEWREGDTSKPQVYRGEFRLKFADGKIVTFPSDDWIKIVVNEEV